MKTIRALFISTLLISLVACTNSKKGVIISDEVANPTSDEPTTYSADGVTIDSENYQESVAAIRLGLTNDEELYAFVAALSLINSGIKDTQDFLKAVDNKTAQQIIELGRKHGFDFMVEGFRRRLSTDQLRKSIAYRVRDKELPPKYEEIAIDTTSRESRDLSIAAILLNSDDQELYELTTAFDVIGAASANEQEFSEKVKLKTAKEILTIGYQLTFDTAVAEVRNTTPAKLLRAELPLDADPKTALRLDSSSELTQIISTGKAIVPLTDEELYEFITAMDILRLESKTPEALDTKVNQRSVKEIVRQTYLDNPGGFLKAYAVTKKQFPKDKLDKLRAEYIAKSVVLENQNNSEAQ